MDVFELGLAVLVLALFSGLAFWKEHFLLFLLTAGVAIVEGLQWHSFFSDSLGLGISLMMYAYSFVCIAFAYRGIMMRRKE